MIYIKIEKPVLLREDEWSKKFRQVDLGTYLYKRKW